MVEQNIRVPYENKEADFGIQPYFNPTNEVCKKPYQFRSL